MNKNPPIDPKFLEWIGQMMLISARNMEQAEKFMRWFREGYPEGVEWEKWLEPYLQLLPRGGEKGTQELRELFEEFFKRMGLVSRKEFMDLEARCQELKEEIEELKNKIAEERKKGFDLIGEWAELIKKMSEANAQLFTQWQKFILGTTSKKKEGKK